MRRLLVIVLALGLVLGLAACGGKEPEPETTTETFMEPAAPFDLEAYTETLEEASYQADKIAEVFQLLEDYEGILPDEAVMAFAHFLACACEGLLNYEAEKYPCLTSYGHSYFSDPDYPAVIKALEGKLSPGAVRWLELKAQANECEVDIYEPDVDEGEMRKLFPFEHMLGFAKDWHELEMEYPEIAASKYSRYYGNSSAGWVDSYLDEGEYYGLSEASRAQYLARQRASMEAFLADEANREYPFYEEIYQFINQ